jgi:hypothetical protein
MRVGEGGGDGHRDRELRLQDLEIIGRLKGFSDTTRVSLLIGTGTGRASACQVPPHLGKGKHP